MMNKEEGEEIDFSENVSSFKSSDISSSENEENEEGISINQDHNAGGKTVLRDNKILDPRSKNMGLYNKKSSPGFGNSKLTKRKMKVMETEKLFKKYGPHSVFLYKPGVALPDLSEYLNNIIEIRIAKEYLSPFNQELLKRNIWGSETFTSNSDVICILKHSGLIDFGNLSSALKNSEGLAFFCKITKARKSYNSVSKNGMKSRAIKGYQGFSLKPEKIQWLGSLGKHDELITIAEQMATTYYPKRIKLTPIASKKIQKFHQNNFVFNLCDELAYKYCISNICDKSNDTCTWTSYQLKYKSLYFETNQERYELSNLLKDKTDEEEVFSDEEHYKLAKVLNPYSKDNEFMNLNEVPLKHDMVEVIFDSIDWNEIKWGESSIMFKDRLITNVFNFKYYPNKKSEEINNFP